MKATDIAMKSILLANMPQKMARALLQDAHWGTARAGDVILEEGQAADHVVIVIEGSFKLSKMHKKGAEAIIAVQNAGDVIGAPLAFRAANYPVSCTALTSGRFALLRCEAVRNRIMASPDTISAVLAATFQHMHQLVEQIEQLKANSSQKRIAHFLLSQCDKPRGPIEFRLPYEKAVIAGVLGMTPETLSRVLAKLKPFGVSTKGQKVQIESIEQLQTYLDDY